MVSAASGKSSAAGLCRIVFFRSAVYSRYSGLRGSSAKPFIFRSGVRASGRPRTGPNVVGPLSDRCRNAARILSERCQNVAGSLSYASGRLRNLRLNSAVDFAIAFGNSRRNSGCGFCGPHSGTCNGNSGRAVSVCGYCRVRFRPCGFGSAAPPCDPSARYLLEEMPEVLARRGHVDGEAQRLRGVNVLPSVVDEERFGRYHAAVSDHLAENRLRRLQFVQFVRKVYLCLLYTSPSPRDCS